MYDYGLSILEQYGLNAETTARTRGALLCRTEKGLVIIKEFKGSEKKLKMQQELLLGIQEKGGLVDCYLMNQEESLVSRDSDGMTYTLQHWYEGRECDTRSREDIFRSIRTLAQFHGRMQMPTVEVYAEPSLEKEYLRHNQELKKIRSFIRQKGSPGLFEKIYLETVEMFIKSGEEALDGLRGSGYEELRNEALIRGDVCHGEYNQHNVLMLKQGSAVTNFDHWNFGIQLSDLYRFMRKILEKYNWDIRLGREMLKIYDKNKKMSEAEWKYLKVRFSYPEKYWKLANYYYMHKKTWISVKNTEKLQNVIRQRKNWEEFCKTCFEKYPF